MNPFIGSGCNDNRETFVLSRPLRDAFQDDCSLPRTSHFTSSHTSSRDLSRNMPVIVGVAVAIHLPGYAASILC